MPLQVRGVHAFLQSEAIQKLTAQEYTLFKHYMEHTSRDLTVDDQEQYTLQIRIPILAFQCTPLLRSILALSAVCKCSDIIKKPPGTENRNKVLELLNIADQYHMDSLHEIQARLPRTKQYDHVLANAAMMGMYGSGSHCIRIWLTESMPLNEQAREEARPKTAQWTRLFRAVHMAYTGLLKNAGSRNNEIAEPYFANEPSYSVLEDNPGAWFPQRQPSQIKQPRNPSEHALYPILSATVSSAFTILEKNVHAANQPTELDSLPNDTRHSGIRACRVALEIFKEILYETFPTQFPRTEPSSTHMTSNFENDYSRMAQSLNISPWLHRYTASITSMVPSGLPRRFVMAFIHKVPIEYLTLVEEIVGLIHADLPDPETLAIFLSEGGAVHRIALEIFSHWLVLVMLLSDVWWIGDTGIWELKHIVSFRQNLRGEMNAQRNYEDWWPKSMSEISQQLKKYAS